MGKNIADDIRKILSLSVGDDYVEYILNSIMEDVIEDIKETADEEYSDDDIRFAIGRVICKKFGYYV
jgi:hypothetical protein